MNWNEEFSGTLELESPITEEQWDVIADTNFDRTDRITFHTRSGKEVEFVKPWRRWIPVTEGYPEVDRLGKSGQVLLSFENIPFLCVGEFRMNDRGGAFYVAFEDLPLVMQGFIVNAWMPLPDPYREDAT